MTERKGFNEGDKPRTFVEFDFIDLEVIESTEPYPFPTAKLAIRYIAPTESRGETDWEAFSGSLRRLIPGCPDPDPLVGKMQEWAMLPAKVRILAKEEDGTTPLLDTQGKQVWEAGEADRWQLVSVEGIEDTSKDLTEHLLELADGKTEVQFNQAALTDKKVMANSDTVDAITNRVLLPALIEAGKLIRDDEGVLHKA
jgi:hypothetical protein